MSECAIRKATLADYSEVIAIGEMFDGMDYLPDMYEDFINDPDYHCFVCSVDGEIIGFLAAYMIDGNTTVNLRAGRVKETHRRGGYYTALRHHIYAYVSKMGTVKHERVLTYNEIAEKLMRPESGFELLAVQNMTRFDIPEGVALDATSDLQPLTMDDLEDILSCSKARRQLFSDDLLWRHTVPLTEKAVSLQKLFGKRTILYGTKSSENEYILLSIGYYIHLKTGFRYQLYFHGTDSDDFRTHFVTHLARMRSWSTKNISFTICTHPLFATARLQEIESQGGIRKPFCAETEYTFQRKLQY